LVELQAWRCADHGVYSFKEASEFKKERVVSQPCENLDASIIVGNAFIVTDISGQVLVINPTFDFCRCFELALNKRLGLGFSVTGTAVHVNCVLHSIRELRLGRGERIDRQGKV
jgi:hypothetical protein